MEPADDRLLSEVLREWEIPGAPLALDERVLRRRRQRWAAPAAAAAAVLVAAGSFVAGRFYESAHRPPAVAAEPLDRVLQLAVGDYLKRSQLVLVELATADPDAALDVSLDRARAHDLIQENRLYRQTAESTGQIGLASLLEDVERLLLEIEHMHPDEWQRVRRRLRDDGILLQLGVMRASVEKL